MYFTEKKYCTVAYTILLMNYTVVSWIKMLIYHTLINKTTLASTFHDNQSNFISFIPDRPILVAGLLSREQLTGIFLNVEELVQHNRTFCLQVRDALEIAAEQGDEDLLTVNVARLFLQAAPMLHAFETYCVRQVRHFALCLCL